MSKYSRFSKSTVAILTALLIIAIAAPLLSFASAAGSATASLGTTSGPNGTLIKVSGTGFGASEAVGAISISVDGHTAGTNSYSSTIIQTTPTNYQLATDSNGVLTGYFIIYNLAPGAHTVMISDSGHSVVAGIFTITSPTVTLTPSSGAAGTSVLITASGFPTTNATIEDMTAYTNKITDAKFSGTSTGFEAGSYSTTDTATTLSSNKIATNSQTNAYLGTYTGTVSLPAVGTSGPVFTLTDNWGNTGTTSLSLTTPTVTLSPSSGPVGTVVTVTVTGFGPKATISTVVVGNTASHTNTATVVPSATVTEQGTSAFLFTVPDGDATHETGVAGAQTVTVTDNKGNVGTATFTVTPKVTLALGNTVSGSSGTTFAPISTSAKLFIQASGLKPSTELTITASPGTPTEWTTPTSSWTITTGTYSSTTGKISTDANGAVSVISILANSPASAGQYSVTISDGTNSVSTILTITTTGNIIAVSPASGAKGTTATVTYFGTTPSDIYFDGVSVANPTAATQQAWPKVTTNTQTFVVPTGVSGLHTVSAGVSFNSVPFTVIAPTVTVVTPTSASVGTTVTVVGTGYATGTALIAIQGASVTTATDDLVSGTLIATFVIPNYIPGTYTLSLSDLSSGLAVNTAATTFSVSAPQIQITPTTSTLGTVKIAVTGSGFKALDTLTVSFDGSTMTPSGATKVGLTTANTNGGIIIDQGFPVPTAATAGTHTVTVMGASGEYATATFTVQPKLGTLSAVRPGALVTLSGTGFAASSALSLSINGTAANWYDVTSTPAVLIPVGTSVATGTTGSLLSTDHRGFVVSSTETSTALNVTITDASGNKASTILTILQTPTVAVGSTNIVAGTASGNGVSINGTGFTPGTGRSISAQLLSGSTINTVTLSAATVDVAGDGTFKGLTFIVPTAVSGTYTLRVTMTTPTETADTTVTVLGAPTIVAPATAASGSNVTITITGLTAISTATFKGDSVLGATTFGPTTILNSGANAYTLTTWFIMPTTNFAGTYLLTITDTSATPNLAVQAAITVTPSIAVSPTIGSKGATVTVTGTGFAASSTLTAKVNDAAVTLSQTGTSNVGALSTTPATTFVIPVTALATNTLTITDAAGNSASATFNVTAPVIQLTPTQAGAGSTVQIIGSGFTASSPIVIQVGSQVVTTVPAALAANVGGSFITYVTVPTGLSGDVTVTATDNSNNVGTATLSVGGSTGTGVPSQQTMTSTAQTTTTSGTATTTFTSGSTVKAGFMLQSTTGSRDVVVAVTFQQGAKVYNMASFATTMDTTARAVSFTNLIPTGATGTWTATLQVFANDGVTPLGVTTLTFTVS